MKVITVVGARPQFIKAATISRTIARINLGEISLSATSGPPVITEIIVHTGQHYDDVMSAVFFRELEIPAPLHNLGIGSGSHGWQTGQMLNAIEKVLMHEKPDWVLVYGDTNSTLAGALAASKAHIPVAHVEAGLRSYNRAMPEEINRVLTDHISDLLFCPSRTAVDNLAKEGITKGVHLVGDVMYEALMFASDRAGDNSSLLEQLGLQPKEFLLATVHRAENTDDRQRLTNIMMALKNLAEHEPVVLPLHPRTQASLERCGLHLQSASGALKIIDPVGYFDMVTLERFARMILTDSGGIQKEAYWLKVPCITLRDETEWVETVESGWNVISGTEASRIMATVASFRLPGEYAPLYGNSETTKQIVLLLLDSQPH